MSRPAIPLRERFESKVRRTNGCWLWDGTRDSYGYGVLKVYPSKMLKAHRVAWELFRGPLPPGAGYHGAVVMHVCDNPPCVNPAHLRLGTMGDNNTDRSNKGRDNPPRGERCPFAKLSSDDVRTLRREYANLPKSSTGVRNREGSVPALAQRYGVSVAAVRAICRRLAWRHL